MGDNFLFVLTLAMPWMLKGCSWALLVWQVEVRGDWAQNVHQAPQGLYPTSLGDHSFPQGDHTSPLSPQLFVTDGSLG